METKIEIVNGKQGRSNSNNQTHSLFKVFETITLDSETLSRDCIDPMAATIRAMAEDHRGHNFDADYMKANNGAYGVRAIALNTKLEATKCIIPIYRPTNGGGHTMFGSKEELKRILRSTCDTLDLDLAGRQDIHLHIGKFEDLDTLFITPSTVKHPALFEKLRLEKKGDGTNTILLLNVRVCDGLGLGRSLPRLSIGKFKFLFPMEEIDLSMMKTRKIAGPFNNSNTESVDVNHQYMTVIQTQMNLLDGTSLYINSVISSRF